MQCGYITVNYAERKKLDILVYFIERSLYHSLLLKQSSI